MITSKQMINECNIVLDEGKGLEFAKEAGKLVGKAALKGGWKATKATAKGLYKAGKWALGYIDWKKADAMKMAQYAMKQKKNDIGEAVRYLKRVMANQDDPKIEKELSRAIEYLRAAQEKEDIKSRSGEVYAT